MVSRYELQLTVACLVISIYVFLKMPNPSTFLFPSFPLKESETMLMSSSVKEPVNFDSTAVNGLRGFAALHVLIFHCFRGVYSHMKFYFYGDVSNLTLHVYLIQFWPHFLP